MSISDYIFQECIVLYANRLEPRSGPTHVPLILASACLHLNENTYKPVSQYRMVLSFYYSFITDTFCSCSIMFYSHLMIMHSPIRLVNLLTE